MAELERDGLVLAYDDTGERDLSPVVLLHGLSSARSTWRRLTTALGGRYRVLAFDDRGHGESAHAPGTYTLPYYTADAVAFVERVAGRRAVLVGHSLGGVIAACVARSRPDLTRGVLLEDPPLFVGTRERDEANPFLVMFGLMRGVLTEMQARTATVEEYESLVRAAPSMNGRGSMAEVLGEDGVRAQAAAMARLDPEVLTPAIEGAALDGADPEVPLGCPSLVLRADASLGAAFAAEDEAPFLAANPEAAVTEIDGASHLIHDEQPERFLVEVEGFLKELPE